MRPRPSRSHSVPRRHYQNGRRDDDVTAATVACSRLAAKRLPARHDGTGATGVICESAPDVVFTFHSWHGTSGVRLGEVPRLPGAAAVDLASSRPVGVPVLSTQRFVRVCPASRRTLHRAIDHPPEGWPAQSGRFSRLAAASSSEGRVRDPSCRAFVRARFSSFRVRATATISILRPHFLNAFQRPRRAVAQDRSAEAVSSRAIHSAR